MKTSVLSPFALLLSAILLLSACATPVPETGQSAPPQTVNRVNLQKHTGRWYEIMKIPNRFQRQCVRDTTAEYSLRADGQIDVVNRCVTATGAIDQAEGVAHVVDEQSNAKFEVSFVRPLGIPLFSGDYWILNLGDDYEYAIVGTPRRDYGWVLSRTPVISPQLQELIFNKLRERDYDPAAFQATPQRSVP